MSSNADLVKRYLSENPHGVFNKHMFICRDVNAFKLTLIYLAAAGYCWHKDRPVDINVDSMWEDETDILILYVNGLNDVIWERFGNYRPEEYNMDHISFYSVSSVHEFFSRRFREDLRNE